MQSNNLASYRSVYLRYLLMAAGGFALSLAFPNDVLPGALRHHPPFLLAWFALIPLMWAVVTLQGRSALWVCEVYGFAFSLGVLSWMRLFGYLPWVLLALYLSLGFMLAVFVMQKMRLPVWATALGFAVAITGLEWLRGQTMFGFSWGEIGASQIDGISGRMASLGSVYLITFLMTWVMGTIIQTITDKSFPRWPAITSGALLLLCLAGGWVQSERSTKLWRTSTQRQTFAVIQPFNKGLNPQVLRTEVSLQDLQRRQQAVIDLSRESVRGLPATGRRPLIVWPESVLSYPPYSIEIGELCRSTRSYLLAGAIYFAPSSTAPRNSAYFFDPTGFIYGRYDKRQLVPFGEFVPMRPLVERFYTVRDTDIVRGEGWTAQHVNGQRLGIGICFETTFSSIARRYARQRCHYLVFITNDAWFFTTPAVRQHFNHARFRAIETGLPVIRAACTGISGIIAPDGRIIAEKPVFHTGSITESVQAGTAGTVYTRIGWAFAPLCLLAAIFLVLRGIITLRHGSSQA